jgi:ABC-type multidrug transport system ATPase subunit
MRTIATLQEPDAGSIMLNGLDVLKQQDEVRKIAGYLPQEFGVSPGSQLRRCSTTLRF